jgi:hypothetical protein
MFGGVTNESGVFHQAEEIELASFGRCTAIARVAPSAAGMWFVGYEYRLFASGGGCFPSVADREAYPTRDDAIRAITDDLRFVFLRAASISGNPEHIRTQAQKMFEMLKARLDPPAQLDSLPQNHQNRRMGDNHEHFTRSYLQRRIAPLRPVRRRPQSRTSAPASIPGAGFARAFWREAANRASPPGRRGLSHPPYRVPLFDSGTSHWHSFSMTDYVAPRRPLTAEDVVRRIAAECAFVDQRGGVGIRLRPAAAIVRQYGEQFRRAPPRRRRQTPRSPGLL